MADIIRQRGARAGEPMTFVEFAKDHGEHPHCASCAGCMIDPSRLVRDSAPIWCVGCRDRIKAALPPGAPVPWMWTAE